MKTGDICKREVVVAARAASLAEVAKLMRAKHVGSVVIADEARRPVGIVTDRDLVVEVLAPGADVSTLTAEDVMTRSPAVIHHDDDALWALKTMRDRGVRRLPVVDDSGVLTGFVSLDDLVGHVGGAIADVVQTLGTQPSVEAWRRA